MMEATLITQIAPYEEKLRVDRGMLDLELGLQVRWHRIEARPANGGSVSCLWWYGEPLCT